MADNGEEQTTQCPACGHDHPAGTMPVICFNLIQLADAIGDWISGEEAEEEEKTQQLIDVCDDIVNGREEDGEEEVFGNESN